MGRSLLPPEFRYLSVARLSTTVPDIALKLSRFIGDRLRVAAQTRPIIVLHIWS
jgi:hypothetical protein